MQNKIYFAKFVNRGYMGALLVTIWGGLILWLYFMMP
jgi:hypothetical protein